MIKEFTLQNLEQMAGNLSYNAPLREKLIDQRLAEYKNDYGVAHPYYKFFYHLTKRFEPGLVVELGGWQGTSAACFAAGNTNTKVISIDHHTDPGDEFNKFRMQEVSDEYPNLVYLQGWTWDILPKVKELNQPIDILFIDSWHQYDYAMKDWNDYSPLLGNPSLVICDDIVGGDGPVIAGMQRFWEDLPGEKWLEKGRLHSGVPMGFIKYER